MAMGLGSQKFLSKGSVCTSDSLRENYRVPLGITFVNMLKQSRALLLVNRLVAGARQARVQRVINGEFELRARWTSAAS